MQKGRVQCVDCEGLFLVHAEVTGCIFPTIQKSPQERQDASESKPERDTYSNSLSSFYSQWHLPRFGFPDSELTSSFRVSNASRIVIRFCLDTMAE